MANDTPTTMGHTPVWVVSTAPDDGTNTLGREEIPEDLPRRPEPAARRSMQSPRSSRCTRRDECDEKSPPLRPVNPAARHHPSVSSAGGSSSQVDSIDLEKQALSAQYIGEEEAWSRKSSTRHSHDRLSRLDESYRVGGGADSSPRHQVIRHTDDDDGGVGHFAPRDYKLSGKAVNLLFNFLLLIPLLSFALAIWTITITLVLTIAHPIRLVFSRKRSYSEVILSSLAPTVNLHLRCIYSFPIAGAEMQLFQTLLVLTASAFFSVAAALWSTVLSVYWVFAVIIGDPDGLDGRSDGRELILSTRQKWDDWLRLSVRPELRS